MNINGGNESERQISVTMARVAPAFGRWGCLLPLLVLLLLSRVGAQKPAVGSVANTYSTSASMTVKVRRGRAPGTPARPPGAVGRRNSRSLFFRAVTRGERGRPLSLKRNVANSFQIPLPFPTEHRVSVRLDGQPVRRKLLLRHGLQVRVGATPLRRLGEGGDPACLSAAAIPTAPRVA